MNCSYLWVSKKAASLCDTANIARRFRIVKGKRGEMVLTQSSQRDYITSRGLLSGQNIWSVGTIRSRSNGVLEYWSAGKKFSNLGACFLGFFHYSNTPLLHYSLWFM
jgi:hypothetical protein